MDKELVELPKERGLRVALDNPRPHQRVTDVDRHVGMRIRDRRIMLGLTQQDMAELISVTYQQAYKYERGVNRIAAGRLYEIAQALGVGVGYFFEGMSGPTQNAERPGRMMIELAQNFGTCGRREKVALMAVSQALAVKPEDAA